jgi:LysM repeat protein
VIRFKTLILLILILSGISLLWQGYPGSIHAARLQSTPESVPPVTVQPPQPDGSIVHTVQRGDTLASISYAYKVSIDQILKLNNMSADAWVISIGQKLIIKLPDQTPTPTSPPETPTNIPTATPEIVTPIPGAPTLDATIESTALPTIPTIGATSIYPSPTLIPLGKAPTVCITVFEDTNQNHFQESGEVLLAGVVLNLTQTGSPQSLTSAADAPSCFIEIPVGNYRLEAVVPSGYGLITSGNFELDLKPGMQLALSIGVAQGYLLPTVSADFAQQFSSPTPSPTPGTALDAVYSKSGLIAFGLAGIALLSGLALLFRRPR